MKTTLPVWMRLVPVLFLACGEGLPYESVPPMGLVADAGVSQEEPPPDAGVIDTADAGVPAPVRYQQDILPIWNARCTGCHQTAWQAADLLQGSMECFDTAQNAVVRLSYVSPGAPEQSALWIKLQTDLHNTPNPPVHCNREMPAIGTGLKWLDPAAFEKVERWILEGAHEN